MSRSKSDFELEEGIQTQLLHASLLDTRLRGVDDLSKIKEKVM